MSGVDYGQLMESIRAKLVSIAPGRIVTRTYQDFAHRDEADLALGVFTLVAGGVLAYPWDRTDSSDAAGDGPGATSLPVFAFRVLGQRVLPETATGEEIEQAEFEMLEELEALADGLVSDDSLDQHEELCRVVMKGADQSSQLEAPFCWVAALFALEVR